MHLFTVATSCSFVTSGNSFLKICMGIILPLLPMSILYGIFMLFLPADVFKLVVMMNQFVFNWTEYTLTISMSSLALSCMVSCPTSCSALVFLLLQTVLKWPNLLHSMHTLPYAGYCLGGCKLPQYLHACHAGVLDCAGLFGLSLHADLDTFLSNSLDSVILFITAAWALCVPTLFAHVRTLPFVIWMLPLHTVNSLFLLTCLYH